MRFDLNAWRRSYVGYSLRFWMRRKKQESASVWQVVAGPDQRLEGHAIQFEKIGLSEN